MNTSNQDVIRIYSYYYEIPNKKLSFRYAQINSNGTVIVTDKSADSLEPRVTHNVVCQIIKK